MDAVLQFLLERIRSPFILDWVLWILPRRSLIRLCHRLKDQDNSIGNWVMKLSDNVAIKYGPVVFPGQAATQAYAYQHTDRNIVRVPRVYRYVQDKSDIYWRTVGYLFMEYIPGKTLDSIDLDDNAAQDMANRIANIVTHLQEIKGTDVPPGPVGGGKPQGYLWGEDGAKVKFSSLCDVNHWINKRLVLINKAIDLTPYPLVFCHMDLVRRNIILTKDSSICLLDWDYAGFFPRFYEVAATLCFNDGHNYHVYPACLRKAVDDVINLTDEEKQCVDLLMRARAASLRWQFESDDEEGYVTLFTYRPPDHLHGDR